MTLRSLLAKISGHGGLNFFLTNRLLPRRLATRFVGWFSRIEQPFVRDVSIGIWGLFSALDLSEAKHKKFTSLRDCFVRELMPGARPVHPDPAVLVSPCDAIVGASGPIAGSDLMQVKGSWYPLEELLGGDRDLADSYRGGSYVTLRLTAAMYHRFHAPHDCRLERVNHIRGDTWNVNPPTLARVRRVYCRNERVVLRTRLEATGHLVTLVPVAAILVAGIRLRFPELVVDPRQPAARAMIPGGHPFRKGQEMGWFEHGSTIIVLAPAGLGLSEHVRTGSNIRMGEALMRLAQPNADPAGEVFQWDPSRSPGRDLENR